MAGIHLKLQKLLKKDSLFSTIAAVGYSAVLSSGNWIVGVVSVFLFSTIAQSMADDVYKTVIYQIYITYTIALSLIISGPFQLAFTRYVSDQIFKKNYANIIPNYTVVLLLCITKSFILSMLISVYLFENKGYEYKFVFSLTVAVLSALWVTNSLLTGLKSYRYITASFFVGYTFVGISLLFTINLDTIWNFVFFYIGQILILLLLILRIAKEFPSDRLLDMHFIRNAKNYKYFMLAGFFYNLGIWIDKIIFWFSPYTGDNIFANIRASVVYDFPVILAYLSLIPGIAIFFIKVELEFARFYEKYYDAVREWGRLEDIYSLGNRMIDSAKSIIHEVLRIQVIVTLFIIFIEEYIFSLLNMPLLYLPLFNILLVGALLQLTFMVVFALLSYFNRQKEMFIATFTLTLSNISFTIISQILGPYFYGYGYVISLLISVALGMWLIGRFLSDLHYRTFMLGN